MSLIPPARVFLLVLAVKLYVLLALFLLFQKTDLRNGDKGFFFRRPGQSMAERSDEIQTSFPERLAPYDGQWYLDIAANGYRQLEDRENLGGKLPPGNYAFFPLLPGLLRAARGVTSEAYLPVILAILILLSAAGTALVWTLAKELKVSATLTILLLLAFPTAVFQTALYTEGIFLVASVTTLILAMKKRTGLAATTAFLAGLVRPQGLLLMLPLFVELVLPALRNREPLSRWALLGRAAAVVTPLSGFLAVAVFSELATGSATSFLAIQERWGRSYSPANILAALGSIFSYDGPSVDIVALLFGLLLLPVVWRRLPLSLALYGTGMVLLPLATGTILSLGRFLSVSVPHFLALASLLERKPVLVRGAVVTAFAACQALVASGLIAWYLVG